MLCSIYSFDLELARAQIALIFGKKDAKVISSNVRLMEAGFDWAERTLDFKYRIPAEAVSVPQVWSAAIPPSPWVCSPRAWTSAPCTRSRRRPRHRIT